VWGAFEAAVEDTVVNLLMNESDFLQNEAFAKVRVPLAEFEALENEERMRRLVDEVGRGCRYSPLTSEQWVEAVFHAPESLTQVSLQMTVRARCLPWSSAS
jgi:hypothetical protein